MSDYCGVIITDTHLKQKNHEESKAIWHQAIHLACDYNCPILHGGDIFDSRKSQILPNLSLFLDILDYATAKGVEIIAIPGNHDKLDYRSENSYLDIFSHHPSLTLHTKWGRYNAGDELFVYMVPFFEEGPLYLQYLNQAIADVDLLYTNVLITHVAVDGARNNDGSLVSDTLARSSFDAFDHVYVGHYHERQVLNKRIQYIGAAMPHNFGESNEKGFALLTNQGTIEHYNDVNFKRYYQVRLGADEVTPERIAKIREDLDVESSNVRVVVEGAPEAIRSIDTERLGMQDMDVRMRTQNEAVRRDGDVIVSDNMMFDNDTLQQELVTFCRNNDITSEDEKIGREFLKKILHNNQTKYE